jgi:hypothetical protein
MRQNTQPNRIEASTTNRLSRPGRPKRLSCSRLSAHNLQCARSLHLRRLINVILAQGRYAEARKLFNRLLSRCNDVGLLAEEFDPLAGRMLGNFPQAYSHVGLINCALNLSRQAGPAEERAESQAPHAIFARAGEPAVGDVGRT